MIMQKINDKQLGQMLKDVWYDNELYAKVEPKNTTGYIQFFEARGIEITAKQLDNAWNIACDLSGIDDSEADDIEGIMTREEALIWLEDKVAKYGNTAYFPSEDTRLLYQLIARFGNTYFWRR